MSVCRVVRGCARDYHRHPGRGPQIEARAAAAGFRTWKKVRRWLCAGNDRWRRAQRSAISLRIEPTFARIVAAALWRERRGGWMGFGEDRSSHGRLLYGRG